MADTSYDHMQQNGENQENESPLQDKNTMPHNEYLDSLMANPWVQQALSTYDWTKHSCSLLENTLDRVECTVSNVAQAATQKASDSYNNYYVKSKETVTGAYNSGKEKTMWAVETGKSAAVHGGTVGLGAAVLATQLGLSLSAGGAGLLLDSLGAAQGAGRRVFSSVKHAEHLVEEKIWMAVAEAQRIAKIPVDKASESTHSLLDIVRVLVERALQIRLDENPEATIRQRVTHMATAVVGALSNKAHAQVIDPVHHQTKVLLENLSKSFILVDLVRSKREWALEKVEELSSSVSDLKTRLEAEAKQYSTRPEEILMNSIRSKSSQLKEQLQSVKDKGQQVFGDGTRIEGAISYLQELDDHLGEADDIYQVRDEVLSEARQRLAELTSWTSGLLSRPQQQHDEESHSHQE